MPDSIKPSHSALETLEYRDGVMLWGGRKVTAIAEEVGKTPFYVYARDRISARIAAFRDAMPSELQLHYAVKANPMPDVVRHVASLVDGLDVASAGELEVALRTETSPVDISFAGPGKRDVELRAAVEAGIVVNVESEGEMRRLAAIGETLGTRPLVAIRVNPRYELKASGMKMGGRPSPFGVDAERVPAMLGELKTLDLEFLGFHIYSGSQNLSADAIAESMSRTVELVVELAGSTDLSVNFVNLGGGLGIPYFPGDRPLNLADISGPAERAVEELKSALGEVRIIMELGRYLVGEAGIYVCGVTDVKESRGMTYAITDGGLHHHLAASGNFGQVLRKNYPVAAVMATGNKAELTVVGPLCTPLDLLGDRVLLDEVEPGSLVVILQSGAYGRTASPSRFLSHPECAEILV